MNISLQFLQRSGHYFLLIFISLFFSGLLYSQVSTCTNAANVNACTSSIDQNFNSNDGNFTSASFTYSSAGGWWSLVNPASRTSFSITSRLYQLSQNNVATVGFIFNKKRGGFCNIVNSFNISIVEDGTNIVLAQCNVSYLQGSQVCATISDADIVPGKKVRFVISVTTNSNCGLVRNVLFSFDDFSVGASAIVIPDPVPVKLTTFSAKRNENTVQLEWQTASEFNNKGFEIERKIEGEKEFSVVGFVPAKTADGNSADILNYAFSDLNISGDPSQYRLKQIDFDGKYEYSNTLVIKGTNGAGRVLIYPNPSHQNTVNVVFDSFTQKDIQLTDINGRVQRKWEGYTSGQLQLKQLTSGIYLLNITDKARNSRLIRKIIVL